jgi:hypothetical protein
MSRGPGRIERAIRELFDAHPDLAFVTDELAEHCYPDAIGKIERKHQVAALRAAWNVIKRDADWRVWRVEGQGRGFIFFNEGNVKSYTLGREIADSFNVYRSPDRARRIPGKWKRTGPGFRRKVVDDHRCIIPDRAALLASYSGCPHERWVQHIAWHNEWRDGDAETRAAVEAKREAEQQAWLAEGAAILGRINGPPLADMRYQADAEIDKATHNLAAIADRIRALMVQNDPDAVRSVLAEIADQLDGMAGSSHRREVAE